MTVGKLIELLKTFDPDLPVESDCGNEYGESDDVRRVELATGSAYADNYQQTVVRLS